MERALSGNHTSSSLERRPKPAPCRAVRLPSRMPPTVRTRLGLGIRASSNCNHNLTSASNVVLNESFVVSERRTTAVDRQIQRAGLGKNLASLKAIRRPLYQTRHCFSLRAPLTGFQSAKARREYADRALEAVTTLQPTGSSSNLSQNIGVTADPSRTVLIVYSAEADRQPFPGCHPYLLSSFYILVGNRQGCFFLSLS